MITLKKKYIAIFVLVVAAIVGATLWINYQKKVDRLNAQVSEMTEHMNHPWRYNKIETSQEYYEAIRQIKVSKLSESEKQKEIEDVGNRFFGN